MTAPDLLTHERALELLPWLVNGTLQAGEHTAVETHVRTCIACRRELKEQRKLYAAVRAQPAVHVSEHAALAALDRELDAEVARHARKPSPWSPRFAALRPFAVAAAAGLVLLAFLLWLTPLPQLGADGYTTLGATPAGSAHIDIVFAQQTTAAEILALLSDIDGEIVAGPSAVGRYSVRIARGPIDEARLARIIETLMADPRVRFVGRSFTETPP